MNETTRALLLKARKSATASFETKQWQEVLVALGFGFEITKSRNTVTKVTITSPGGTALDIVKGMSRRVSYYELGRWLTSLGFDLVESVSVALGMDTPEVEKKLLDLYVRDLTNTGTCAVCCGNFKRNDAGGLVLHGYTRPGDGSVNGSCPGVGYLPWELSPIGAEAWLADGLIPHLARSKRYLATLLAGEQTVFHVPAHYGRNAPMVAVTPEDGHRFTEKLNSVIRDTERDIEWTRQEVASFKAKIAGWKLDVLPEFKYAGKFKVAG